MLRLLDQAQAQAPHTTLFWGHLRSLQQGMISDVQPLVNHHFGRRNEPQLNFSILPPPPPYVGATFLEGVGVGPGGWRVKNFFVYSGHCASI